MLIALDAATAATAAAAAAAVATAAAVVASGIQESTKAVTMAGTLLFDLDGTLYPLDNGYHTHVVSASRQAVPVMRDSGWSS